MAGKLKTISCLLAVMLCMAAFSVTTFAANGYYASDEHGSTTPPDSIDSITVSTESVKLPDKTQDTPLTPDGNMTLIDDILQSDHFASVETTETVGNKQFITVQSKNGNYFYLVIDRSGDTENVYFLNLVDESDLLALIEDESTEPVPVSCTCSDKCVIGSIDTECEICRTNLSDCSGKAPVVEVKPEPDPDTDTGEAPEQPSDDTKSTGILLLIILIVVCGVGGAVYWFKFRDTQPKSRGGNDLDDYDFGQNDEDEMADEETEIDDADLMAEAEQYTDEEKEK